MDEKEDESWLLTKHGTATAYSNGSTDMPGPSGTLSHVRYMKLG